MVLLPLLLATVATTCGNAAILTNDNGHNGDNGDNGGGAGIKHGPARTKDTAVTHVPQHCLLDAAPGLCRAYMPKFFFNVTSGQCEKFVYGGCGGNLNRFDTLPECHRECTCKTPPETGPCRGHIRRWFYSPADGCCRPFIYGGCVGNSNNHGTWTECSQLCGYPTVDSKWWEWGADWWNWNAHLNKTASAQINETRYSQNDFMRDWILWGLLTGGEGEIDMEEIATMIAQAHILGFGRPTGGNTGGSALTGAHQHGTNSLAETQAALRYFQHHFGGEAESSWGGGMEASGWQNYGAGMGGGMGAGMHRLGPAYSIPRPGSFTPLGEAGSDANFINLGSGSNMHGAGFADSGQAMSEYMNQWGAGQFGQGAQSNQYGQFGHGAQSNQHGQFGHGAQVGQTGQGSQSGHQGYDAHGGGFGHGSQAGQFGQGSQQGHGWMNSDNSEFQVSAGEYDSHQTWGESTMQNMGNRRHGWAPHGESILPGLYGAGQFGSAGSVGAMSDGGAAILYVIGQLSSGNFNPADFMELAKRFGALQQDGGVNIEKLAQQIIGSFTGQSAVSQISSLKGVAKALGALDINGNVDTRALMAALAKFIEQETGGVGGLGIFGGGAWGKEGGARMTGGGTIGGGQIRSGTGSVGTGGGSNKKMYGKK